MSKRYISFANVFELRMRKKSKSREYDTRIFSVIILINSKTGIMTVLLKNTSGEMIETCHLIKDNVWDLSVPNKLICKALTQCIDNSKNNPPRNHTIERMAKNFIELFEKSHNLLPPTDLEKITPKGIIATYYCQKVA